MSHHDHQHHNHCHGHAEHANHGQTSEEEKLIKMVEHWMHHSDEHARSYRDWAERARAIGHEEVYTILEEVARATQHQNQNLEKVLTLLKPDAKPV